MEIFFRDVTNNPHLIITDIVTGAMGRSSTSNLLESYPGHALRGFLYPCRGEVGVFYVPSQQGGNKIER